MERPRPLPQLKRVSAGFGVAVALLLVGLTVPAPADAALPFTVNNTRDEVDTNPGNGLCQTFSGPGQCSLRAAIQEANASIGADTIIIEPGVYELEVPTLNEDLPETGDYDIHGSLTIVRSGAPASAGDVIIDGGFPPENNAEAVGLDRLFEIHPTALRVTFSNLTLREGYVDGDGAAIQNWSSGIVRLEGVDVLKNRAMGAGGGINNGDPFDYEWLPTDPIPMPPPGRIEILNSRFSGNGAGGGGAAINNVSSGYVSIASSRITDNPGQMIPDPLDPEEVIPAPGVYEPESSPIVNAGAFDGIGTIRITSSTLSGNYANPDGGAIANDGDGILSVENSTLANNTSEAAGGAIWNHGGSLTILNSTVTGNAAADGGGVNNVGASSSLGLRPRATVANTTISNNTAIASGGG